MNEEQIIKLAEKYLRENNQNFRQVLSINKNFFFTVTTEEGVFKVKQVDKTIGEKYSTADVEDIFKLKKYTNPVAVEDTPSIDFETEYIDIESLPLFSNDDTSIESTLTDDNSQTAKNCYELEKNQPAELDDLNNVKSESIADIAKEYPNCNEEELKKISNHRKEYLKWRYYFKIVLFEERNKFKLYNKQLSENSYDSEYYDEFQKQAFDLYENLKQGDLTQGQFISEMKNSLLSTQRERLRSRFEGFDNLLQNSLEILSLRRPAITSDADEIKQNFDFIKKRGLLDYLLRNDNKKDKRETK